MTNQMELNLHPHRIFLYQVNFHGFLLTANSTSNYSIQIHLNASIMQYAYFAHVTGSNTYMSYSTAIRAAADNILTIKLMNGLSS